MQEAAGLIARLDAAAARLGAGDTIDVGLERRAGFGAWAWTAGRVGVTPALVAALDDDELAAVLAHELGHLGLGGDGPAAVAGDAEPFAVEHAADRAGCALLAARGIPPPAMVGMLRKLANGAGLDVSDRIAAATLVCTPD